MRPTSSRKRGRLAETILDRRWKPAETSGQKAAMNGILNFSVLDGWWYEGYKRQITAGRSAIRRKISTCITMMPADAESLYRLLEEQIVPLFFDRTRTGFPTAGFKWSRNPIRSIVPRFRQPGC